MLHHLFSDRVPPNRIRCRVPAFRLRAAMYSFNDWLNALVAGALKHTLVERNGLLARKGVGRRRGQGPVPQVPCRRLP